MQIDCRIQASLVGVGHLNLLALDAIDVVIGVEGHLTFALSNLACGVDDRSADIDLPVKIDIVGLSAALARHIDVQRVGIVGDRNLVLAT